MSRNRSYVNRFGKNVLMIFLFAFLGLAAVAAVVLAYPDFSGSWVLNEQKSDMGQFGRMVPRKLQVSSGADSISIEEKITTQDGEERSIAEKLSFDGKEIESTLFGNSKRKSAAKWSDDGQTLHINSTILFDRNGEVMEIKVTEHWKLMDNNQALSVESSSQSSWGTNNMKLIYEKAQ